MADNPAPRRRWFQVRLREWFLLVARLVVGLGWWREHAAVEEQARRRFEALGIAVVCSKSGLAPERHRAFAIHEDGVWWVSVRDDRGIVDGHTDLKFAEDGTLLTEHGGG